MNITIEKLARTNGEQKTVTCDQKASAELTAMSFVRNQNFDSNEVEMGDVLKIDEAIFLVEGDNTVTEIEQDEYAYYKGIDVSERLARWFSGSYN